MLAAKGGRSRLYSVRTVVQCHRTHFAFSRRPDEYLVWAYAFPDRVWLWADMSSTVLGLDLSMYNLKTESGYDVNPQSGTQKIDGPDGMQRGAHFLHEVQLLYFHETAWMRPELKRVLPKQESPPGTDG